MTSPVEYPADAEARETILGAVRERLADRADPVPHPPPIPESIARQVGDETPEALWGRFASALAALGDRTKRIDSKENAAAALELVVREESLRTGIIDADALEWIGVPEGTLGGAILRKSGERAAAFKVDFGVTLCDCAVAETGTIALGSNDHRARLTSLAPPIHIALIPFSRLRPDLLDVFENGAASDHDPSESAGRVWITGSSRTADIEGIMIRGVHGPGKVIALGIADA